MGAMHTFVGYTKIEGWLALREAVESRLLQITRESSYEGLVKKLLLALRLAEKSKVIELVVQE